MISDLSTALSRLKANPQALQGILRGIEREGLRININGSLAQTKHPEQFGSALTHKWITTDFAEALLEFITPVDDDINHMLTFLRDIHRYVARHLNNELLWPMSMPCFIDNAQSIKLARYGNSNIGRMKTLYRKGLKNRYSALMQVIAGVHYNFSLPLSFWQTQTGIQDMVSGKEVISNGYLRLIRNYYRFGWIIPYLFGASPGICPSFLKGKNTDLPFKQASSGLIYLPYATSLRLSNIGYTNKSQNHLNITFNNLKDYVNSLKQAINTPFADYQCMGLQKDGHYLQLNTNILQIENELYTPIRPKRVIKDCESMSDALMRDGIEYVEIRSLDINPFSMIGIDEKQIHFLDLFLIWCALVEAPEMSADELRCTNINWNRVILEGRKPGLMLLGMDHSNTEQSLITLAKSLFNDLLILAKTMDCKNRDMKYQSICNNLAASFDNPELTISARFLNQLIKHGIGKLGLVIANNYHNILCKEPMQTINEIQLDNERLISWQRQFKLETTDNLSFDEFLMRQQ